MTTVPESRLGSQPPLDRLADYDDLLRSLKERIRTARVRATLAVNRELVLLYWEIGRTILDRQGAEGWGARVIDRLAADMRGAFPDMKGFSPRNLKYMRSFAEAHDRSAIVQGPLAQITWYHHIALLEKLDTPEVRVWYAEKTIENGWSRNVLVHQIETRLHLRQGQAPTNVTRALPASDSDRAATIAGRTPFSPRQARLHYPVLTPTDRSSPPGWPARLVRRPDCHCHCPYRRVTDPGGRYP